MPISAKRTLDMFVVVCSILAGAFLAATWVVVKPSPGVSGAWPSALGSLFAVGAVLAALASIFLAARVPLLESRIGQDKLLVAHRMLGPSVIVLLAGHLVGTVWGYAAAEHLSIVDETVQMVTTYAWMVPATLAALIFFGVSISCIPQLRRKLRYETWWATHLYFYVAVALAFGHQITSGQVFVSHPLLRSAWIGLYLVVFVSLVWFRLLVPLLRSFHNRFHVVKVRPAGKDTVHVWVAGKHVERLQVRGGQFFAWRFLIRHHWWQAHPYSVSSLPKDGQLRITIKNLGDASAFAARLRPGTRVCAEGPYGVFTASSAPKNTPIVFFAAGVGITPVRAMLEELEPGRKVSLVYRTPADDPVLLDEVSEMCRQTGVNLFVLSGPRQNFHITPFTVSTAVPDIFSSQVFICGPTAFTDMVVAAVSGCGVAPEAIHMEEFVW